MSCALSCGTCARAASSKPSPPAAPGRGGASAWASTTLQAVLCVFQPAFWQSRPQYETLRQFEDSFLASNLSHVAQFVDILRRMASNEHVRD